MREQDRPVVVDIAGADDDTNLPPRLQGVDLVDARLLRRQLLERREPLDVVL